MSRAQENLTSGQRRRLERFRTTRCIDLHCHCLPGLDDGPATLDEAISLCRALADDGITHVTATPHQLGRYDGRNEASQIRQAVGALNSDLADQSVPLSIIPGADVRLDERILDLLHADRVMTLGDAGKHLLLELPHEIYIDLRPLVLRLAEAGITAIVSHPERHVALRRHPQRVSAWLDAGAILQITAGSLVGDFGGPAAELAWHWLTGPHAAGTLVATDAHDVDRRPPRMTAAIDAIAERLGHPVARRLCIENPALVYGED